MHKVINEGVKVLVSRPGDPKVKGTVDKVIDLDTEQIYIIDLEDGRKIKASIEDLVPIQEEKKPEKKDEITITRDKFSDIAVSVVIEEGKKFRTPLVGLAFAKVMAKLEYKLFGDPEND